MQAYYALREFYYGYRFVVVFRLNKGRLDSFVIYNEFHQLRYAWIKLRFFELLLFLEIAVDVQGKLVFLYDRTKFLVFNHFSKMLMAN